MIITYQAYKLSLACYTHFLSQFIAFILQETSLLYDKYNEFQWNLSSGKEGIMANAELELI